MDKLRIAADRIGYYCFCSVVVGLVLPAAGVYFVFGPDSKPAKVDKLKAWRGVNDE